MLKSRIRRVEEENIRKDKEIEKFLDPTKVVKAFVKQTTHCMSLSIPILYYTNTTTVCIKNDQ